MKTTTMIDGDGFRLANLKEKILHLVMCVDSYLFWPAEAVCVCVCVCVCLHTLFL